MLNQTSQYALRALGYIATVDSENQVGSATIAESSGVPHQFLLKILNTMTIRGILHSTRGVGGGFRLAKPAESITMYEVVTAFENISRPTPGLLGDVQPESPDLREMDSTLRNQHEELLRFLRNTTLDVFNVEDFDKYLNPDEEDGSSNKEGH